MSSKTIAAAVGVAFCSALLTTPARGQPKDERPRAAGKQERAKAPKAKSAKRKPPRNLAVKAMKMTVQNADFDELTFEDFADWLRRTTQANVVVRWKVLEKEGIERDYPITLKVKKTTMKKVLQLVFDQLTEDLRSVELAARADANTLIISTKEDINAKRFTRSYPVQDLLISIPNFPGMTIQPGDVGRDGGLRPTEASRGTGVSFGRSARRRASPEDASAERLIEIITTHIQPLSWKINGGRGTISHFKGRLVIYNNIEVHQELAGILGERHTGQAPGN